MHIDNFLAYIRYEKRYSPMTYIAYKLELTLFQDYLREFFQIRPIEARRSEIKSWIYHLSGQGLQPVTINRKIAAIKSFYRFHFRRGTITQDPAFKIYKLKTRKMLPYVVDSDDLQLLLDELEFPPGLVGLRDKVIIEVLYGTGLRVSELASLKDFNFNPYSSRIKVTGKGGKDRIVPLYFELRDQLQHYILERVAVYPASENLFLSNKGTPITARQISDLVKKYLSLVSDLEKKTPHVLRHSFATHLLDNGANLAAIKDLLGHENLESTQIYSHVSYKKKVEIHKKCHPKK